MTAHLPPQKTTRGVIVPKKMTALTAKEVGQDRSVDDFCKWVENFGANGNQTGHFLNEKLSGDFAEYLRQRIEAVGGYIDVENAHLLVDYIITEATSYPGWFTCIEAAWDFARQVQGYILNDGYIGSVPVGEKNGKPSRTKGR